MSTHDGLDKDGEINISTFIKKLEKIKGIYGDLRVVSSEPGAIHDPSGLVVERTSPNGDGTHYIDDEGELTIIVDQILFERLVEAHHRRRRVEC